jgi:undecaprenyl diphosphate synthase
LFAFSSENWRRPAAEVAALMSLFVEAIDKELRSLHESGVRVRFIGDRLSLPIKLQNRMLKAETQTAENSGLKLQLAVSYGGRWDILNATQRLVRLCSSGALSISEISEELFGAGLQLAGLPEPDLFIRTGGEHRISNFLLWDLAYTELYFADVLWPDFGVTELELALERYAARERRFGLTAEQIN